MIKLTAISLEPIVCENCGDYFPIEHANFHNGAVVCADCAEVLEREEVELLESVV